MFKVGTILRYRMDFPFRADFKGVKVRVVEFDLSRERLNLELLEEVPPRSHSPAFPAGHTYEATPNPAYFEKAEAVGAELLFT